MPHRLLGYVLGKTVAGRISLTEKCFRTLIKLEKNYAIQKTSLCYRCPPIEVAEHSINLRAQCSIVGGTWALAQRRDDDDKFISVNRFFAFMKAFIL